MSSENYDIPSRQEAPDSHRRRRRYPWILLALLLLLAALTAAAPAILSTSWGQQAALDRYNDSIPGDVSVDDLSLSWLGGQSLTGLTVRDAGGEPVLRLQSFVTDLSLIDALRGRLSLGRTEIRGLDADLRFDDDGNDNLSRALGTATNGPADQRAGPVIPITGNMTLVDSRVAIAAPGIEPVVLESLSASVEMSGTDAPVALSFSGRSRQGDLQGSISLDGTISGLFADGALAPGEAVMDIDGRVDELPVDALDQLTGAGGLLTAALGDRMSLTLKTSGDARSQNISLNAGTPNGDLALEGTMTDGSFKLTTPASARLQVTGELLDRLNTASGEPAFRLAAAVPLRLELERLDVPLAPFSLSGVAIRGAVHTPEPVRLTDIREIGDATINDLRLSVDSESLNEALTVSLSGNPVTSGRRGQLTLDANVKQLFDDAGNLQPSRLAVAGTSAITGVPTALVDTLLGRDGLLVAAVGPEINLELEAETGEAGNASVGLKLDSERIKTESMAFDLGDHLTLASPARARITVTPNLWRTLLGEDAGYQIAAPTDITVDVNNMRLALPGGAAPALVPAQTQLQATLSAEAMSFTDTAGGTTRIENLVMDLGGESLETIDFDLSGEVVQSESQLADLDALPLRISLEAETGLDDALTLKKVTGQLALDSPGLKTTMRAAIDQGFGSLTLAEPATLHATITPALLAATRDVEGPGATLQRPAKVEVNLSALTVPLSPFAYSGATLEGDARIDTLAVASSGGVATDIQDARMTFGFQGKEGGRASLDTSARVHPEGGDAGDLSLTLSAGNLLDEAGLLNMAAASLELDGNVQHLPVALVDQLLNMDGLAVATLGGNADLKLRTRLDRMRGPVTVSLSSPNTRADIEARIQESGLTLAEPLTAQVQPTPEFGSQVLANVHPIFETLQRSEQPIRFEVPAEGVLIPIDGYEFSRVAVPEITMDFGKLVLKSGWLLRGVIGLSQQFGKLDSVQKDEWEAWFTPGVMAVEDGRVLYKRRLDLLLAQKLHLATWGGADVAADRSELVLAFMPDTMERVFSITVSGDDALHVPIEGSLSSPSIDYKKAGKDLARLRAQEEVAGENDLAGALLGAVTGRGAKSTGGEMPPASVDPLPWAAELEALDAAVTPTQQDGATKAPAPQTDQAQQEKAPEKTPSTEEKVIKGLVDIFGGKKKE